MERPPLFVRTVDSIIEASGSIPATTAAMFIVIVWLCGLPFVQGGISNNTYQLLINTFTTIITFVMVFYVQAGSNRDMKALHAKLDALMEALEDVPDDLVGLEQRRQKEIKSVQAELRDKATGE